ncbi:MAG: PAAR-like domain-containing protein [Trinickia sp.]|uniref:PAAR-like domain-containing protein n=1 Tax=Trinickia sp. TaxID=2571163 RepID=UPI003F7D39F7
MASQLGARKNGKFKAVSTAPSINKTPVGSSTPPLPYPVTEDLSSSVGIVPNVRFNGDPAYVLDQSTQPSCIGDAAGSCKGVKSGTVSGEVKPVKGSSTVRISGKPVIREGDPCTLNGGNCPGIYLTEPAPSGSIAGGRPSASTNPPVKPETPNEAGWWGKASPWVHGALGLASFVPGLGIVTGAADAGIYAAEGDMVDAGLSAASMIPGGKIVTTAGKLVKGAAGLAREAHAAEEAAKLAREAEEAAKAAKLEKEAEEAAKLKKTEEEVSHAKKADEEADAGKGEDGAKVKGKKKLKCGEYGKYGDLKKKTGDGKFDRDHVPSKAALKERAESLLDEGEKLSSAQKKAIEDWGDSIAIPRRAHIDVSPTYGSKNVKLAPQDAEDLAGAARRDVEAMLKQIDEYDADGGCKKAYQKAAKRVLRLTNKDFDKALLEIIKKVK